jgi:sulfur-oxidizing protein SoxB
MDAERRYKVAGWAPVAEGASGEPIWDLASRYLRSQREIRPKAASRPHLLGVTDNPGLS